MEQEAIYDLNSLMMLVTGDGDQKIGWGGKQVCLVYSF